MIDLPRTAKGRATRARIIAAAAGLIGERGVAGTSLDDVIERAAVSKGQLYHYFQDKADLLRAVVTHQADMVLAAQEPELQALDGWDSIRAWLDRLVALQVERRGAGAARSARWLGSWPRPTSRRARSLRCPLTVGSGTFARGWWRCVPGGSCVPMRMSRRW